jgi:hypothetical protein
MLVLVPDAQRPKGFQRKSHPRVGFLRFRLGILDVAVDPAGVILLYNEAPRLSQKSKPRELIYALLDLRTRPTFGVPGAELSKNCRQLLLIRWQFRFRAASILALPV